MKKDEGIIKEYDSKYSNNEFYWGNKPHDLTIKSIQYLSVPSKVLDLGCGEGKDSFYLAKKGFNVTSVDISVVGINKLQNCSIKNKLKIDAKISDINSFLKKCNNFDAIYCINILQFINKKDIISTIDKIKSKTKSKGLNVIASFIAENDEQKKKIMSKSRYSFDREELKNLYKNWKIIFYLEKLGKWETHGEPKHRHFIVKMIAQKP